MNNEALTGELEPLQSRLHEKFPKTLNEKEHAAYKKLMGKWNSREIFDKAKAKEELKEFYYRVALRLGIPSKEIEHFVYEHADHPEAKRLRDATEKGIRERNQERARRRAEREQKEAERKGRLTGESSAEGAEGVSNVDTAYESDDSVW
jgi:epoxyqueuosine reductase QueG